MLKQEVHKRSLRIRLDWPKHGLKKGWNSTFIDFIVGICVVTRPWGRLLHDSKKADTQVWTKYENTSALLWTPQSIPVFLKK